MSKPSHCRYSTQLQMTLEILLRETNTGQISLLGPKTWSKISPTIRNVKTMASFIYALKKNTLFHLHTG